MRTSTAVLAFLSCLALGASPLAELEVAGTSQPQRRLEKLIVPVSQSRTVAGDASAGDDVEFATDSDADQAEGFGPFVSAASAYASAGDGLGTGGGSQDSRILGSSITAMGSSFANGEGYGFAGFGSGSGSSHFQVTFDVPVVSRYTLSGFVEAYDNGGVSVSLLGDSGPIFGAGTANALEPFEDNGTLLPGRYTLVGSTSGSAFGGGGFYSYAYGAYDLKLELTGAAPRPQPR